MVWRYSTVTIEKRESNAGHKRTNFTVILECLADGTKLPAMCIFKLKTILREVFPPNVIIRVNEKGGVTNMNVLLD